MANDTQIFCGAFSGEDGVCSLPYMHEGEHKRARRCRLRFGGQPCIGPAGHDEAHETIMRMHFTIRIQGRHGARMVAARRDVHNRVPDAVDVYEDFLLEHGKPEKW